ncbi:MAG: HutD family protein [Clostridia bacterium]|nr:HutD family protein [Clostridia bacterium]
MEKKIYKEENYTVSRWSGGNTRELAIYPENAKYLERDFIWRLSSADSDQEESSFTKLPDFDRILMVLAGEVVLAHGEERSVSLKAMEQDSFDGAIKTKCFGRLEKDYNLIMRKGCRGRMEVISAENDAKAMQLSDRKAPDKDGLGGEFGSYGFFCSEGHVIVSVNGQSEMVRADQQMVINCRPREEVNLSVMGEGTCIFTEVVFEKNEMVFEPDTAGASSSGDMGIALKLFLSNNRWSKLIRREKKKGLWYSPELEKKLAILDKFFITGIVWIIGVLACLCTMLAGLGSGAVIGLVAAYTILDLFLISPLIYKAFLPKPLSAHVKDSEKLNPYEKKMFEEQAGHDLHQEKLMHKYRDRSGESYDGVGDFIKKLNK